MTNNQTNTYKRLCYVIERDQNRERIYRLYLLGYGIVESIEEAKFLEWLLTEPDFWLTIDEKTKLRVIPYEYLKYTRNFRK